MEIDKKVEYNFYTVPLNVDIILYKNNYIDNLIISEIKKNVQLTQVSSDRDILIVQVKHLKRTLSTKFKKYIDKVNSSTSDDISTTVNSAFFLNNIIENFVNLKTIKIQISSKRNFTRIVETEDSRIIGFQYKITNGLVDYPKYMSRDQILRFNKILKFLKINQPSKYISNDSYFKMSAREFIKQITSLETIDSDMFEENIDIFDVVYDMIESKVEEDDSILIIKTDF